jgi:cell division protease FtsH
MPDPDLTNRLQQAEVEFTRIVPKEASPIVTFIASWVLPLLIFFFLGRLLMGYMQRKTGGANAMTFGKSNAKVYVRRKPVRPSRSGRTG